MPSPRAGDRNTPRASAGLQSALRTTAAVVGILGLGREDLLFNSMHTVGKPLRLRIRSVSHKSNGHREIGTLNTQLQGRTRLILSQIDITSSCRLARTSRFPPQLGTLSNPQWWKTWDPADDTARVLPSRSPCPPIW